MTTRQRPQSGTLNVFLHGAFAFVPDETSKQIHALIPNLSYHTFRAGPWLAETEIQGRGAVYELEGVERGDKRHFDRKRNVLVKYPCKKPREKPRPYATFRFPYPKKITSLRSSQVPSDSFKYSDELVVRGKMQQMSTLQIFEYHFDDVNKLALKADKVAAGDANLEDHHWEPAFTGKFVNLHIFSSEDFFHKPSNAQEDFNQCVALLGIKLRLNTRFLPGGEVSESSLPKGVSPEETEDLSLRTRRLAQLGRLVVQKQDANLAWYENEALDGSIDGCGDCIAVCVPLKALNKKVMR